VALFKTGVCTVENNSRELTSHVTLECLMVILKPSIRCFNGTRLCLACHRFTRTHWLNWTGPLFIAIFLERP